MKGKPQFKAFQLENIDYEAGTVEGYASTFGNADKVNDVVVKGAFKHAVLNGPNRVRFLKEHNPKCVIGVITEMYEDDKGLYIKAQFADTRDAQETRNLMKMRAVDSFSIGYRVLQETKGKLGAKSVNFLKEIQLLEVSVVAWPCNVEATMVALKSEIEDRFEGLNLEQQTLVAKFIDFIADEQKNDNEVPEEAPEVVEEAAVVAEAVEPEVVAEAVEQAEPEENPEDGLKALAELLELHVLASSLRNAQRSIDK